MGRKGGGGSEGSYGGKKWVLRRRRNRSKFGELRRDRGNAFQTVGAAKKKDRRPSLDLTYGIFSNFWADDLRA